MVNDPIGDMLIQLKNAALAGRKMVELPHSRTKHAVADVLRREGYLSEVERIGEPPKSNLRLTLMYRGDKTVFTDVKRVSKPGLRRYVNMHEIPMVVGGIGITILSTSKGIMTGKEAKRLQIGGELLCKVW